MTKKPDPNRNPGSSLIAEAITEAFGERCPDFEPDCWCCKAWAEFDAIRAREAELVDALERAREELRLIRMKDTGAVYDTTLRQTMDAVLARTLTAQQEGDGDD